VQVQANDGTGGIAAQTVAISVAAPAGQAPSGRVLTVGAGQQFASLNAALAVSKDGDVIAVQAGTYTNDISTVTHSVTIEGVGGLAHFQSTGLIANDKAILIDDAANLTIQNLEFSGAQVWDSNGAGIRYEAGNLVVKNSYFHDNQDGILGGAITGGNVTIDGSTFTHNGAGDGQTHAVYLGMINKLTVTNSFFQDQLGGSDVKSRAATTLVDHNQFIDNPLGDTNYQVDLPNGGNDTVSNNVILKSFTPENRAIIHFGGEVANPVGSLLVQNNQFYALRDPSVIVMDQAPGQSVTLTNNGITPTTLYNPLDGSTGAITTTGAYNLDITHLPSTTLVNPTIVGAAPPPPPPADAPPVTSVPGSQTVVDLSALALAGIVIADPDGASQSFTVTLTATDGTVSTAASAGTVTGNGTSLLTLAGSLANVNTDLAALGFKGTAIGAGALQIQTSDGAGGSDSHVIAIAVTDAPPITSVPGSQTVVDGSTRALTGIAITDADGANQSFTVTLAATDGTVSTGGSAGTITGNGTAHLTLAGSLANVNADLAALGFKGTAIGAGALQIQTSDGAGGSDSHSIGISVTDAAPVTTVPGSQTDIAGIRLALTGIAIADADGANQSFTVTLSGTDGNVSTSGTVGTITGNGTGHMILAGSLANVNSDLASLSFTGSNPGAGSLLIQTNDGAGGSNSHTIGISVTAPSPQTLIVGANQPYTSLASALAASHDGDTIMLQAGTYSTGAVTVSHAVTIEGTGGTAHLVASNALADGGALITTANNVTLANLEISGATSLSHSAVAIKATAGNLTMSGVNAHNNDSALADSVSGSLVQVSSSDFGSNGGGKAAVIDIGAVGEFDLSTSKVHDSIGVTEVRSLAGFTGIGYSQLTDGSGSSLYALDLPNVGNVIVAYTVLARGAGALDPSLIHLGGGMPNPPGYLTVHDSTFTSVVAGSHALNNQTLWNSIGFQHDGVSANITQIAIGGSPAIQGDYVIG
jgi:hypothetical protein